MTTSRAQTLTARTYWETVSSDPSQRRLVREWSSAAGRLVSWEVVCVRAVAS